MLGLSDFWIWSVYLLCLLSTLLCVIYGMINWNRDSNEVTPKDRQWEQDEDRLEDQL